MRRIGLSVFAVVYLCGPAADGAPAAANFLGSTPIYRELGDWVLACDNVRTCTVRYANPSGDGNDGYLSFSRAGGRSGAASVTLSQAAGGRLELDGRPLGRFPWMAVRRKSREQQVILEDAAALKFIRTIRDGRELSYNSGGSTVALDGFKAALAAMDEVQAGRRVPTANPLVYARPTKAQLSNPKALSGAVRRAKEKALASPDCDLDLAQDDRAFALDDHEALVALACNIGAYNTSYVVFLTPKDAPQKAKLLQLPLPPTSDPKAAREAAGVYVSVSWDARTATFQTRAKDRGRGDCGERTGWTFDGKDFQLTRYDKLAVCGGGPEGDWPTLYRARVVVR